MELNELEILLVEDNPHEAELTIRSLKKHNLTNRLLHIDDGAEALDFIFSKGKYSENIIPVSPKLVLLDLKLPGVDGFEVLKWIRAQPGLSSIIVVVLTSSDHIQDVNRAYQLGANSFMVKPMDFENIVELSTLLRDYWILANKSPESVREP